jgi:RNA polymerase sigma-54 factor
MALQLKQSLSLSQQLIMTPQLQMAIKLLQLSRLELLETITQEMETNPLLDEQPTDETDEEKIVAETTGERNNDDQPTTEVTMEEKLTEDMDWETYLSEYNTGWAEAPYDG